MYTKKLISFYRPLGLLFKHQFGERLHENISERSLSQLKNESKP